MTLTRPFAGIESVVREPSSTYEVSQASTTWITPAARLKPLTEKWTEIRYILEKYGERHTIFVVLQRDPNDLLDAILDVEAELYREFRRLPFDLRILTPGEQWKPDDLLAQTVVIYQRDTRDGSG